MFLHNRYELLYPIGHDSIATIFLGRDIRTSRAVAISLLLEEYCTNPKFVRSFQTKAQVWSDLNHPNIVQVYDYGQIDDTCFIVMEHVEGTDLRRYLHSRGILDADRTVIIAHDIALGSGEAHHRGIIHRNVKPQNILVGRGGSFKLTDFITAIILGMAPYNAPEQAQGKIVTPALRKKYVGTVDRKSQSRSFKCRWS